MNKLAIIEAYEKQSTPTAHQPQPNDILAVIGAWGPWQRRNVLLIFLCKIPAAWFMACIIFTAPFAKSNEFMCIDDTNKYGTNITIDNAGPTIERIDSELDICDLVFRVNEQNQRFNHMQMRVNSTIACSHIRHESVFDSLVTSFDLVCSRTILIAVTQFLHLCGVLSGGILATNLLKM